MTSQAAHILACEYAQVKLAEYQASEKAAFNDEERSISEINFYRNAYKFALGYYADKDLKSLDVGKIMLYI